MFSKEDILKDLQELEAKSVISSQEKEEWMARVENESPDIVAQALMVLLQDKMGSIQEELANVTIDAIDELGKLAAETGDEDLIAQANSLDEEAEGHFKEYSSELDALQEEFKTLSKDIDEANIEEQRAKIQGIGQ